MAVRVIVELAHHWQLALITVAGGLVLGFAFVAVYYLAVPVRLCLAADEKGRARVLEGELGRLKRLGDAAAVSEEHGLPMTRELRAEAELRTLLLRLALRRAQAGRRFREES